MPARRRTAPASSSGASSPKSPEASDPAYKIKRKKNNEAVQRTREKSKKSAEERKKRIDELKEENIKLKEKIEHEKKNIQYLRDLILSGEKSEEDHHRIIQNILDAPSDDDEPTASKRTK